MKSNCFTAVICSMLIAATPAAANFNDKLLGFWNHNASQGKVAALIEKGRMTIFKDLKGWYHAGYRLQASFQGKQISRKLYSGKTHILDYHLQGDKLDLSADGRSLALERVTAAPAPQLQQLLKQRWRLLPGPKAKYDAIFDGKNVSFRSRKKSQTGKWRIVAKLKQIIGDRLIFTILNMSEGRVGMVTVRTKGDKLAFYRYRSDADPIALFQRQQ